MYLADRVIPMLPRKLSNGICSLNAGTDRLALSCLMDIDEEGTIVNHEICETVICVDRRMTYTMVADILDGAEAPEEYKDFVDDFKLMKQLSDLLRKKRSGRGAIDFDFPESKIILDEKGRPIEIKAYEHSAATRLIEGIFMLLTNETIAEEYYWLELPFVIVFMRRQMRRSLGHLQPSSIILAIRFILQTTQFIRKSCKSC